MAKTKYYYDGKLIRTSDHEYTHAVINMANGKCEGCRGSYDKALAVKMEVVNRAKRNAEWERKAAAAKRAGKKYLRTKVGRRTYPALLDDTPERYEERAKGFDKHAEEVMANWEIVELTKEQ